MTDTADVATSRREGAKLLLLGLALIAAYWIAARMSLQVADQQTLITAVWLPSGIALAATLPAAGACCPRCSSPTC